MAFQVAFDLFENKYHDFLFKFRDQLPESKTQSTNNPSSSQSSIATQVEYIGPSAPKYACIDSPTLLLQWKHLRMYKW